MQIPSNSCHSVKFNNNRSSSFIVKRVQGDIQIDRPKLQIKYNNVCLIIIFKVYLMYIVGSIQIYFIIGIDYNFH